MVPGCHLALGRGEQFSWDRKKFEWKREGKKTDPWLEVPWHEGKKSRGAGKQKEGRRNNDYLISGVSALSRAPFFA